MSIFPITFGLLIGSTLFYERNPRHIFQVFVANPISIDITEIKARDIPAGFSEDVVVIFKAQNEVIDEIISPKGLEFVVPHLSVVDNSQMRPMLWHEFAHSFINPLTEQYTDEVNQYQASFAAVETQMKLYGYGSWETTVNEHIVRAVTLRLKAREFGESAAQASLDQEQTWGFRYIGRLVEQLKRYELQRSRCPAFGDYYYSLLYAFSTAP